MAVNVLSERRAEVAPDTVSVSVVIPCLNEADSIGQCVEAARRVLDEHALDGEVVVVDNGSDDGSATLALLAGARVVEEPRRGYGSAYLAGFAAARGDYIVMIDADLSYDFEEIPRFIRELENGAELVMGNRMGAVAAGRDVDAEPDRQPVDVALPQSALPHAGPRHVVRPAGVQARRPARARVSRRRGWSSPPRW